MLYYPLFLDKLNILSPLFLFSLSTFLRKYLITLYTCIQFLIIPALLWTDVRRFLQLKQTTQRKMRESHKRVYRKNQNQHTYIHTYIHTYKNKHLSPIRATPAGPFLHSSNTIHTHTHTHTHTHHQLRLTPKNSSQLRKPVLLC